MTFDFANFTPVPFSPPPSAPSSPTPSLTSFITHDPIDDAVYAAFTRIDLLNNPAQAYADLVRLREQNVSKVDLLLDSSVGWRCLDHAADFESGLALLTDMARSTYWAQQLFARNVFQRLLERHESEPSCAVASAIVALIDTGTLSNLDRHIVRILDRLKKTPDSHEALHGLQFVDAYRRRKYVFETPILDTLNIALYHAVDFDETKRFVYPLIHSFENDALFERFVKEKTFKAMMEHKAHANASSE